MPEPIVAVQITTAAEQKWAAYNARMAALFRERNKHDVNSPEREAAAQRILALWAAEG